MTQEMDIAPRTMRVTLSNKTWDLGLSNDKQDNACIVCIRRKYRKSRHLLSYSKGDYKEILFTDEKIFTMEETSNRQNDRFHAQSYKEARELVPRIKQSH